MAGIGSIKTPEATQALIELIDDARALVRLAAMRQLSWRLPDPRDTKTSIQSGPFKFYSCPERLGDIKAAWRDDFKANLVAKFEALLNSESLEEVAGAAYNLSAVGSISSIPKIVTAADRITSGNSASESTEKCVNSVAEACCVLAQLGAEPPEADVKSAPGRLAVWANMIRTKREYRKPGWDDLILFMLNHKLASVRMAAIRWMPDDFAKVDEVPWKNLFLDTDHQIYWHAIQIARGRHPRDLQQTAEDCVTAAQNNQELSSNERELKNLVREEKQRLEKKNE